AHVGDRAGGARARLAERAHRAPQALRRRRALSLHGAVLKAATAAASPPTLNPAQLEAVHHLRGPCLVLAGAGSGKTRVIVHKIARLLDAGYAPGQVAAITFTNKAAADVASGGGSGDERSAADALVAARVMERYQERLAAYQAVDFDDLIVLPAKLLARDDDVRAAWRERLRYVLVDEYQDTNGVQY